MLRQAMALAHLVVSREWEGIGAVEVVIGLRGDAPYDWVAVEAAAAGCGAGVSVRRMEWTIWPTDIARRMFPALGLSRHTVPQVALPRDYRHNFLDCDAWIVFGSSTEDHVAPMRPYAVYCADMIQRHVPQVFDTTTGAEQPEQWATQIRTFLGWRAARCVFSTTPQTLEAVVGYAGVSRTRALLVPTLIDPLEWAGVAADSQGLGGQHRDAPSIVWVTNPSPHKNHPMAVEAARIYYDELGGALPLTVTGVSSDWLEPGSGIDTPGTRAFRRAPTVVEHTQFVGEVSDRKYLQLIKGAGVVWHNAITDNGTFVAFDAARAERHFVSCDYPQMRYLCDRYGVATIWHRPDAPHAAAEALLLAETRFRAGAKPGHRLHGDTEEERVAGYAGVLNRLIRTADA